MIGDAAIRTCTCEVHNERLRFGGGEQARCLMKGADDARR
jgi:hypothetical protein